MLEVGQILGWVSALVLLTAFVAWLKPGWRPLVQKIRGRAGPNRATTETAPKLLISAIGLGTVAAILAVTGCVFQ